MTHERWRVVEDLFHQAVALAPDEREDWLRGQTGEDLALLEEVRLLLQSDSEAAGFVQEQVQGGILDFHTEQPPAVRTVGPYRLVRQLGQGGMGTVWLAERADGQYQGEVAIKLVRPGMDTDFFLTRFRRERQTLARLRHPHIARLLDSGTAEDGLPYIVMERVDGRPVNQFCREEKLDVEAILRLFLLMAEAVAYAHHNFVVHRDLKPGNILVEAGGKPKLLDFGICKLLFAEAPGDATVEAGQMMTPDYASPEQVRGEPITIASDVYSLGAVLYELLTGRRPHRIDKYTPQGVEQAVCEQDVPRPSTVVENRGLARHLAGDLDNILLKAMQKEPGRRYASVEQFAEDVRRVLDNQPVMARPETIFYVTGKFLRRNRIPAIAAGVVMVCLVAGLVAYAREAALAKSRLADARMLANTMIFDIYEKVRNLPGSLQARQAIIGTGVDYLDRMSSRAPGDPSIRRDLAAAYLRMGEVQGSALSAHTGDTAGALASFRKGIALLAPAEGNREVDLVLILLHQRMGDVLAYSAGWKPARTEYDRAIAIGTKRLAAQPEDEAVLEAMASAYIAAGRTLRAGENRKLALEYAGKAAELDRKMLARRPGSLPVRANLALAIASAGTAKSGLNRLAEARRDFEESIRLWEEICTAEPANAGYQRNRMLAYSHLGDVLGNRNYPNLGDAAGAGAAFHSMLDIARQSYQANPGDQSALIDFGMSLMRVAALPFEPDPARAAMYEQAAKLLSDALGRNPANGNVRVNLASLHEQLGDLFMKMRNEWRAVAEYRLALEQAEAAGGSFPAAPRVTVSVCRKLGEWLARRGRGVEARAEVQHGLQVAEKYNSNGLLARAMAAAGGVHELLHEPALAREWRLKAVAEYRKVPNEANLPPATRRELEALSAALSGGAAK